MAKVWELSAQGPMPDSFAAKVEPGVIGVIGPHDDYIYAARTYREIFPLVTAKTVVIVGVFHRYRRFEARDQLVFDTYRAWSAPDGEIPVSTLRDELIAQLPAGMAVKDAAAHDSEHSIEGIAYFLKHARRDVEIVPVIVPAASFQRLHELASHFPARFAASMQAARLAAGPRRGDRDLGRRHALRRGLQVHTLRLGGVKAYLEDVEQDRKLMRDTLGGIFKTQKARDFYETVVNPDNPDQYRVTWCGRFSVTLGTMLVGETAKKLGCARLVAFR
jgi:hypothetical protein